VQVNEETMRAWEAPAPGLSFSFLPSERVGGKKARSGAGTVALPSNLLSSVVFFFFPPPLFKPGGRRHFGDDDAVVLSPFPFFFPFFSFFPSHLDNVHMTYGWSCSCALPC